MNYQLPKHIISALLKNQTSLGEHPALPPDEEETFLYYLLEDYYNEISNTIEVDDVNLIKKELQELLTRCKKIETSCLEALEKLCENVLNQIFEIPEETISIECKLTDSVDVSQQRIVPERTADFSFDDIDDMSYLTQEIYKRRILNALIVGASMVYANNIEYYVQDLFKIHPELPSLYKRILDLNTKLLYMEKDTLNVEDNVDAGKVDVNLGAIDEKVTVNAEAIIFPVLLEETIKGILEVAIAHGLPKERNKAEYVIKKADFKLAENWDMRLGVPLWLQIVSIFDELGLDILDSCTINFFFYELAQLECDEFNSILQNVFKGTKKGKNYIKELFANIQHDKELDDFNDFMSQKNTSRYELNDEEQYFTSDELLNLDDDYFTPEELIVDSL